VALCVRCLRAPIKHVFIFIFAPYCAKPARIRCVKPIRSPNALLRLTFLISCYQSALTIIAFFRILVLYPEVQKRAQKELDAVTGGLRLPDPSDRPRLPYIDALCKEVMRWSMATPVGSWHSFCWWRREVKHIYAGVPHATTQDDIYEGYLIPKGSVLLSLTLRDSADVKLI
jgi:hypothetical protein